MKVLNLFLCLLMSACAALPNRSVAAETKNSIPEDIKYYFGEVLVFSPDGKILKGKTISLVKRFIKQDEGIIVEIVLQPPRNPNQKPKDIVTTMTRIGSSNEFSAVDDGQSFDGKLTFQGTEWQWENWTYDITLVDKSKLVGSGKLDFEGIKTEKTFYRPDGVASVLLREDLKSVSEVEYEKQHQAMLEQK